MTLAATSALSEKHLQLLCTYFKTVPQINTVILFGSRALKTHKKGSDIDLAISGSIDPHLLLKIQGVLNEELPISLKFDIVHLESISHSELIEHIKTKGVTIFER
jgi:predicted nucleotidyltransferase